MSSFRRRSDQNEDGCNGHQALEALGSFSESKVYYEKANSLISKSAYTTDSDLAKMAKTGLDRVTKDTTSVKALQDQLLTNAKGQKP